MIKIAMISPGFLPIPAVRGGAVEVLATHIIEGNERSEGVFFDVYTVPDENLNEKEYKNSRVIQIQPSILLHRICKLWNILNRNITRERIITEWQVSIIQKIIVGDYNYILVENDMIMCKHICKVFKHKNIKIIYHMHNGYDADSKTPKLVKEISKRVDKVLAISNYIKNEVLQVAPTAKIDVLYNAIDLNGFRMQAASRETYRKKFLMTEKDRVFIYSGRITEEKGVRELLEAFIRLKKEEAGQCAKLLIVGKSWFASDDVPDYVKELQILAHNCDDITFTGYVLPPEMPSILAAADIAVIPSKWEEPFGLVVLEAMAAGLKIVTTNSGAIPEIVDSTMAEIVDKESYFVDNLYQGMKNSLNADSKAEYAAEQLKKHPEFNAEFYYGNFCRCIGITNGEERSRSY